MKTALTLGFILLAAAAARAARLARQLPGVLRRRFGKSA